MGKIVIIKGADYSDNAVATVVTDENLLVKDYTSEIIAGKGYNGNKGTFESLSSQWCSVLVKMSDCTDFTPTGIIVEATTANPNNAVAFSDETTFSSTTKVYNQEPMLTRSDGKYYALFSGEAIAIGVNFNVPSSSITALKVTFYS